MRKRDFIITSLQPWDMPIGSNAKDIALEISKQNRVLYINTPLDKKSFLKDRNSNSPDYLQRYNVIKGATSTLRQISASLWVMDYPFSIWPANSIPDGKLFDWVNRLNNKKMYQFAKKTIKEINFKNYLLLIDNDIYRSFYAVEYLKPIFSIYYRRDNMTSAFWRKHAPRLEPRLCQKSNLVVANSPQLAKAVQTYNQYSFDIGQGVDLSNYNTNNSYQLPKDMENIPRPIIGYVGWVTSRRLDANLLYQVALRCPQYSFVMVGGEDDFFKKHPLHSLSNVHFLGQKKQIETISYMSHFDVCMNPQLVNEITIGNYPRKVDEYLALGKPVLATKTLTMDLFTGYVWNCLGAEEYIQAINEALIPTSSDIIKKRIEFAHTHTWENSINKLYSYINI